MSVSNIVNVEQNEGGVHLYGTLDSSNPSSLWLIPSAPVFKKWFITGEPASLSPAPALLRGAITVRSAELRLPASDQTPVCFYRCSTALWKRPPARSSRGGRSKLHGHGGWKAGLPLSGARRCPPDNNASAPAEPTTPVHPAVPPWLCLLLRRGSQPLSGLCVHYTPPPPPPPLSQGLWTATARRAAHGAVNHKPGGKEKRALRGSAFIFGYNLEKEWNTSGLAYLRPPLLGFVLDFGETEKCTLDLL